MVAELVRPTLTKGVPDLAPARDQIWLVMTSAELGRGSGFGLYRRRGGPSTIS
jgi:hypothetical protein